MIASDGLSKDWDGDGMGGGVTWSQHLSCRIGWVNDILAHIMVRVGEDWVETQSGTYLLCHYPRPDAIFGVLSVCPVHGYFVYPSLIKWEEGFGD